MKLPSVSAFFRKRDHELNTSGSNAALYRKGVKHADLVPHKCKIHTAILWETDLGLEDREREAYTLDIYFDPEFGVICEHKTAYVLRLTDNNQWQIKNVRHLQKHGDCSFLHSMPFSYETKSA